MISELKKVLLEEEKELKDLLDLLEKQHKLIASKSVFSLEAIVEEIQLKNRALAESEVNRRKVLGSKSIKEVVSNSKDEELDTIYRKIGRTLNEIVLQKDTNGLLIKQQLVFTNRMLTLITPKKDVPTYNSYGNIKR